MRRNFPDGFLKVVCVLLHVHCICYLWSCNPSWNCSTFQRTTVVLESDIEIGGLQKTLTKLQSGDTISPIRPNTYDFSVDSSVDVVATFYSAIEGKRYSLTLLNLPSANHKVCAAMQGEKKLALSVSNGKNTIDTVLIAEENQVIFWSSKKESLQILQETPTAQVLDYGKHRFKDISFFGAACGWKLLEDSTQHLMHILKEKGKWYTEGQNILRSKKPIQLHFWASWCGPCRAEFEQETPSYFSSASRLFIALEYDRKAPQLLSSSYGMAQALQVYPFLLEEFSIEALPTDILYFPDIRILWYRE